MNVYDKNVKISENVMEQYMDIGKNYIEPKRLRILKLKRNWVLGSNYRNGLFVEIRSYGNLVMFRNKFTNEIYKIYNNYEGHNKYFNINPLIVDVCEKQFIEDVLGMTDMLNKINIKNKYLGYSMKKQFYMDYINRYGYIDYYSLLIILYHDTIEKGYRLSNDNHASSFDKTLGNVLVYWDDKYRIIDVIRG